MISKLLKSKKIIYFIVLVFSVYGIISFQTIAKREFPNTAIPAINIKITAPGYTAQEVDKEIIPLVEESIKETDDVDQVFSYSFDNGAMSVVQFSMETTDVTPLHDELDKELAATVFPDNVEVSSASDFAEAQVIYTLTGKDANGAALSFKEEMEELDNITKVEISNENNQQLVYTVDPTLLEQANISYSTFVELVAGIGTEVPLGYIEENGDKSSFIANNNFTSASDLESYQLVNGVTLGDIGEVTEEDVTDTYYDYNGEQAVFLSIYFANNIDYTAVGEDVLQVEDDFKYDGEYKVNRLVFQPDSVDAQIQSVFINLLEAVILVVIIVMIGLGIRNSILIGLSLPFTILGTIGILNLLGQDLQQISIAGLIISIGIVVDNAIVINEAIVHKLDSGIEKRQSIIEAVKENSIPVLTSTATTVAAFSPIIFLSGLAGVIAFSLPITVIIALILSYIFSVVITPLLADNFIKGHQNKKVKKEREFKFLRDIIYRPYISIIIIVISCALAGISAIGLEIVVFPTADKDIIYIDYTNTASTEFDKTVELNKEITNYVDSLDYIAKDKEAMSSVVGGRMPQFYSTLPLLPLLPNQGFVFIEMDESTNITETKNRLNEDLISEFETEANIKAKEIELNAPTAPIILTISGDDTELINSEADEAETEINKIEGVAQVDVNVSKQVESYILDINDDTVANFGVTSAQIEAEIAAMLNKSEVNVIDNDDYANALALKTTVKSKDELLDTTFIFNEVPLQGSQLFTIEKTESYDKFTNINYRNSATVDVYLEPGVGVAGLQNEIEETLAGEQKDDLKYIYSGETDLMSEVFSGIGIAAGAAIVAIFIILLLQFGSFRNTFIILLTVPLSFVGSIIALRLFNLPISFTAGLGLTALMGIVVNNGILLLSYIKEYEKKYEHLGEVCYLAIKRRFRPIVLSNTTTAIGLIPLIISGGDFFKPMAVALAGGIIVGTLLTIFVVPSIYYLINNKVFNKLRDEKRETSNEKLKD